MDRIVRWPALLLCFGLLVGSSVALAVPCCSPRTAAAAGGAKAAEAGSCHEVAAATELSGSRVEALPSDPDPDPDPDLPTPADSHLCGMACHVPALGMSRVVIPSLLSPQANPIGPLATFRLLLLPLGLDHVPLA